MSYFIKKTTPTSKGVYLQIYQSYYVAGKGKRNKSYKKLGYVTDLEASGIVDPLNHFKKEVDELNEQERSEKVAQIDDISLSKHAGHFLLKSLFNKLDMDSNLNILAQNYKCKYDFADLFKTLVYSQVISPGSKYKAFEKVIPSLYGANEYSYDQILGILDFIGKDYHKYIEVLNMHISKHWKRDLNKAYFDCTNYYFEIDLEKPHLRKGPSKEKRTSPLLGHALMLDADQIPIDSEFYPGNQSERSFLRKRIEDMKSRNSIKGKVIQVADKGLNCARNIYAAVVEANDGYIFSKSFRGTSVSKEQREWITKSDDGLNKWTNIYDSYGNVKYSYKEARHIGTEGKEKGQTLNYFNYKYRCKLDDESKVMTEFIVKEKRIVTYNPTLARKQRAEINKQVDKLRNMVTYKQAIGKELGDSVKYINCEAKDDEGKKVKIATSLNQDKIDEDLKYCGYNMLVTSEIDADPNEIYKIYHNLWKIEESFRTMKTYLESRPVFLSKESSIHGHFLICYISLTLMRLLELKVFEEKVPIAQLFKFIRQYNVTKIDTGYINCSTASKTYEIIKSMLGLSMLGNAFLRPKDLKNLMEAEI